MSAYAEYPRSIGPSSFAAGLIGILTFASSCVGTETGNPTFDGTVQVLARTSDAQSVSIGSGSGAVVTEAWVSVVDIAFAEGCSAELPSVSVADIGVVDLVVGLERPWPLEAPVADYCRALLTLAPATTIPMNAPEELRGATILLRGRRADSVPFEVIVDRTLMVTIGGTATTPLGEETRDLLVAFDLATWFEEVDLDAMILPMDVDVLQIGGGHQADVLARVESAIVRSSELFLDANANGVLDAEESTPLLHHP